MGINAIMYGLILEIWYMSMNVIMHAVEMRYLRLNM